MSTSLLTRADRRIAAPLAEARNAVRTVETDVRGRVEALRAELAEVRPRLEAEIRRLAGGRSSDEGR